MSLPAPHHSTASSGRPRSATRLPRGAVVGLVVLTTVATPSWTSSRAQAPAESATAGGGGRCLLSNPIVRGIGGATIGGWIGFVAAKIRLSDWNDDSRSGAAVRTRNRMTIVGAAVGALAGALMPHATCRASTPGPASVPRASRLPIMADEIRRSGAFGSVYEAVNSLRRTWLNERGVETLSATRTGTDSGPDLTGVGEPHLIVYLDNTRLGTVDQLRELPTAGVIVIRYYDPAQATLRWGAGHTNGAIQVVTVPERGGS